MNNIFDYLKWRGDLEFRQDSFNEVDNLILSELAYLELDGLVSSKISGEGVSLTAIADFYQTHKFSSPVFYENPFFKQKPELLQRAAETSRYSKITLSGFINQIDHENSNQFSAVVFTLDNKLHYVAFRGTDDTIAGWKEDFQMSFMDEVPAQKQAVSYINKVISALNGKFYMGGHSKGGNLAVYAAAFARTEYQHRIIGVYNNDGPGFQPVVIESDGYQNILGRIYTFIPKSSIVGLLMEHGEEFKVVRSIGMGIMQHNALNWEVMGHNFVYEKELTKNSLNFDTALRSWLNQLSREQRVYFVDALFDIIQAAGVHTISELSAEKLNAIDAMIKSFKNMDPENQLLLKKTILIFFKESQKVIKKTIEENLNSLIPRNRPGESKLRKKGTVKKV